MEEEKTKEYMKECCPRDSIEDSNLELYESRMLNLKKIATKIYKTQGEDLEKSLKKIFSICIKELPRNFIIEMLKKKKIIEQDWNFKGEKYIERKQHFLPNSQQARIKQDRGEK